MKSLSAHAGRFLLVVYCTFGVASPDHAQAAREKTPRQIYSQSLPAIGCVYVDGRRNGSCFLFDGRRALVISNYHTLAQPYKRVRVSLGASAVQHDVQVVLADPSRDISVLRVRDVNLARVKPLLLSRRSNLYPGERIFAIGHPGVGQGSRNVLLDGLVSTPMHWGLNGGPTKGSTGFYNERFAMTTRGAPGMSGSAVLDTQGEVIGLWFAAGPNAFALARSVCSFLPLLKTLPTGKQVCIPPAPYLGVLYQELADTNAGHLAEKTYGLKGVYVAEVLESSPAVNLREGDVVCWIRTGAIKKNTYSVDELARLVSQCSVGQPVELGVSRYDPSKHRGQIVVERLTIGNSNDLNALRARSLDIQLEIAGRSERQVAVLVSLQNLHPYSLRDVVVDIAIPKGYRVSGGYRGRSGLDDLRGQRDVIASERKPLEVETVLEGKVTIPNLRTGTFENGEAILLVLQADGSSDAPPVLRASVSHDGRAKERSISLSFLEPAELPLLPNYNEGPQP